MPKISFICPSYNHEKYVSQFIESLLGQSEEDWELILIDDYSKDNNVQVIQSFKDKRIKLIRHNYNQGINACINEAISTATANIISLVASDDKLHNDYVKNVLSEFEKDSKINLIYVGLQYIDDKSNLLSTKIFPPHNMNKYEILKQSFINGNQLPSPGMSFKKDIIKPLLPLAIGMFQYHDWQLNNLLLLQPKTNVKFIYKPLILYRFHAGSASSRSESAVLRENMETRFLMDSFAKVKDIQIIKKVFGDCMPIKKYKLSENNISFLLGNIALTSNDVEKQKWGYQTILNYISLSSDFDMLHQQNNFEFYQFISYANQLIENSESHRLQKQIDSIHASKFFKIWQTYNNLLKKLGLKH